MDRKELIDKICPTDKTYECGQVGCSSNCEKCEEVLNALLDEYDKQIKADAIDECMTILKAHHIIRTCEDDYIPKIERPFYQNLWNRFKQLKEKKE